MIQQWEETATELKNDIHVGNVFIEFNSNYQGGCNCGIRISKTIQDSRLSHSSVFL